MRVLFSFEPVSATDVDQHQDRFNSSNHHETAPYVYDHRTDTVVVESKFWNELCTATTRNRIKTVSASISVREASAVARCREELARTMDRPEPREGRLPMHVLVRTAFNDQYNFEAWAEALSPWMLSAPLASVTLSDAHRAELLNVAQVRCLTGRMPRMEEDSPVAEALAIALRAAEERIRGKREASPRVDIDSGGASPLFFAKFNTTSGKNDRPVRPVAGVADLIDFLASAKTVAGTVLAKDVTTLFPFDRPLSVEISAWVPGVEPNLEFRVFVADRKLTAIAQQRWYADVGHRSSSALRAMSEAIAALVSDMEPHLPFPCAVLDVLCLRGEGENDFRARLIECNPHGTWASSGASLFHWIDAPPVRTAGNEVPVRFVVSP